MHTLAAVPPAAAMNLPWGPPRVNPPAHTERESGYPGRVHTGATTAEPRAGPGSQLPEPRGAPPGFGVAPPRSRVHVAGAGRLHVGGL